MIGNSTALISATNVLATVMTTTQTRMVSWYQLAMIVLIIGVIGKMTNLEYLRSLEARELAEFILVHPMCPGEHDMDDCACYETCKHCWAEWLCEEHEDE